MPCYEVQRISVEFHAENKELLMKALKSLGWKHEIRTDGKVSIDYNTIVLDLEKGKAEMESYQQDRLNQLKRAYSQQAIAAACKQNLWMNKTAGDKMKGQFVRF